MASIGRDPQGVITRQAGAAIAFHRVVKKGTTDLKVIQATAASDDFYGVAVPDLHKASYVLNDPVPIATNGIVNVEAGAAVAVGKRLTVDANGKAIEATALSATVPAGATAVTSTSATPAMTMAGSVPPQRILGIALTAAAADADIIEVAMGIQ